MAIIAITNNFFMIIDFKFYSTDVEYLESAFALGGAGGGMRFAVAEELCQYIKRLGRRS